MGSVAASVVADVSNPMPSAFTGVGHNEAHPVNQPLLNFAVPSAVAAAALLLLNLIKITKQRGTSAMEPMTLIHHLCPAHL